MAIDLLAHASPAPHARPRPAGGRASPSPRARRKRLALGAGLAVLAALAPAPAGGQWLSTPSFGPLSNGGSYWYYGVGNDGSENENDNVLNALQSHRPWTGIPERQRLLRDNAGGARILQDLRFFHDNVRDGDVFVFYYGGHGTQDIPDADGDEPAGGTGGDEGIGRAGDFASDDQLAADPQLGSFARSSTIIVIVNSCFAGGLIGGTRDLDRPAILAKHNFVFMGSALEGCPSTLNAHRFPNVLREALETGDSNRDGQVSASEFATRTKAIWEDKDRFGETLALRMDLDAVHDRPVTVPEPASLLLVGPGLAVVGALARRRRRRET